MRFVVVNKEQRTPRAYTIPPRESYAGLHKVADASRARMARAVRQVLREFRAQVQLPELADAIQRQRVDLAVGLFDWEKFRTLAMAALKPIIHDLVIGGGEAAARRQRAASRVQKADEPPVKNVALWMIYRAGSPEAERYAREQAGTLIQGVTVESQATVRDVVSNYIRSGEDYGKSAQRIKDAVGLTRQGARAVDNFRAGLEAEGRRIPPARVDSLVASYAERLLKLRAETISRTETINAVNRGQASYWEQLMGAGLVERGKAMKQWVVTPDDRLCQICADLSGVAVGINDKFTSAHGSVDGPPLHPNCRCAVNLLPEGEG